MRRFVVALVTVIVVVLFVRPASAHKPSDAYLTLDVDGAIVHGRWDIAVRDLDYALDVDGDGDGKVSWGELRERRLEIVSYVTPRLAIRGCTIDFAEKPNRPYAVATHSDGAYVVLHFDAQCSERPTKLDVAYRLFFDIDAQHRGLLKLEAGSSRTHVFSAGAPEATFDLSESGRGKQLGVIVREGILHIWKGYDHVLFLLALLLPSVLRREDREWIPVPKLRPALVDVLRIVTAFTLAHSITLSLAALGVVTLPSRLVESAIAASVVLAAANNLYPILRQDRWVAAFLLGLMHGFGFSSTLMDLDLPKQNLLLTLFGFNLGVEIGQVAIVSVFVPLAYVVRRSIYFRRFALIGGSIVILALAMVWLVERAFLLKLY